jgi:hypothetical protein
MQNIQLRFYISSTLIGYKSTIFNALKKLTEMSWMLKKILFLNKNLNHNFYSKNVSKNCNLIKHFEMNQKVLHINS